MEINYENIITKANARKEALIALISLMEDAENIVRELEGALNWTTELLELYTRLDAEGRDMLPSTVNGALSYLGSTTASLRRACGINSPYEGINKFITKEH